MFLTDDVFKVVLDSTPLVSIDLIVRNTVDQVLLGQRVNRPAQGYWFVPGGRILKNESMVQAFTRLTMQELGQIQEFAGAVLQGAYEHFYQDSVFGHSPSTHYVALAYRIKISNIPLLPKAQHSAYRWFSLEELLAHPDVHPYTKAYFSFKD